MFNTIRNTLRLRRIKKRYDKMLIDSHKRYLKDKDNALNFMLEEIDRRLEQSDATINYYNSIFKE